MVVLAVKENASSVRKRENVVIYNIAIAILFVMMILINYVKNKDIKRLKNELSLLNSEYNSLYNQKAQHDAMCPMSRSRTGFRKRIDG